MRHTFLSTLSLTCMVCLMAACGGNPHFINDEAYRLRVEQDFKQKTELMPDGGLFDIFGRNLDLYEREALRFLYAYMPLADITDHTGEFYLDNVRATQRALAEMPWGTQVDEELVRHFVLPVRVNNEALDNARTVFYDELADRVRYLSMYDAVLEVNHWCHEKAVYQPSDARTSSPLATVRTAYGRCGEESVLLVAALRSVGIPARQVYTPRWAHTDDNHAWVEAWADGAWHFLGACEPEPVLDLGWFNAPASRGMLMHTKVFGRYNGPEEVVDVTPNYTEINVTANYAPTAKATVTVTDKEGTPVSGACVEFKLYNYAEFYSVAVKHTDKEGRCSLTAGKGDMLVWASEGGRFGLKKLSFGQQDSLTVILDKRDGDEFSLDLDIVPPAENATLPHVSPEQRAANDRRMAQEDSIRNAYTATFLTEEEAAKIAGELNGLNGHETQQAIHFLTASRGNHNEIARFLKQASDRQLAPRAITLLSQVSEKDLRDARSEMLADHLLHTPGMATERYASALLNPRISTEELTPYKSYFQKEIGMEKGEAYRQQPQKLVDWCRKNIKLNDSLNSQHIPMSPQGVWKSHTADTRSRDVFFVAVARSLGIPAWIDSVTGKVRYQDLANHPKLKEGETYDVDFEAGHARVSPETGMLSATYKPSAWCDDPKYYTHFTLSLCEKGKLHLQSHDENNATWSSLLEHPHAVPAGYYVMTSGTRLANGGVLARLTAFNVEAGQSTQTRLVMRESRNDIQVTGSFNSESLFTPTGDKKPGSGTSILNACGRGYFVIGILNPGQEPTNHALKDMEKLADKLDEWGRPIVLLFPDQASADRFKPADFPHLPTNICYGVDTHGIADQIITNMKLKQDGSLPLFIIADTFNRVVFASQGYTIGLGEQLTRVINGL